MKLKYLSAPFACAVALSASGFAGPLDQSCGGKVERAQLPPPFGAPGPIIPGGRCSPHYRSLLKFQIEGLKRLQRLTRSEGEKLCATLEGADELGVEKLIDPKSLQQLLTPEQRELLESFGIDLSKVDVAKAMRLLGIDLSKIDLQRYKQQCRQSQGGLDRFTTDELGRLEKEIVRCDDRI